MIGKHFNLNELIHVKGCVKRLIGQDNGDSKIPHCFMIYIYFFFKCHWGKSECGERERDDHLHSEVV